MPHFRRFPVLTGYAVEVAPGWEPVGVVVVQDEAYVVCRANVVEDGVPKIAQAPADPVAAPTATDTSPPTDAGDNTKKEDTA